MDHVRLILKNALGEKAASDFINSALAVENVQDIKKRVCTLLDTRKAENRKVYEVLMREKERRAAFPEEAIIGMSEELTPSQRALIARNRERAEQLRLSQIVANDQNVYASVRVAKRYRPSATDGGFIPEDEISEDQTLSQQFEKDEELTDDEFESGCQRRTKRHRRVRGLPLSSTEHGPPDADRPLPLPPDEDKPVCDQCNRTFDDSFLRKHFDVDVCDRCR
ncbi:hypothetical protein CSKR_113073, partial [Clonorchis sinensis]